ncbi:hypothetical protein AMTRI_Chr01g130590 [Amborella trichopoda]
MAGARVSFGVMALLSLLITIFMPAVQAQSLGPAPQPASDGTTIDQGIAYVLMLVALVLTYLIHPLNPAEPSSLF